MSLASEDAQWDGTRPKFFYCPEGPLMWGHSNTVSEHQNILLD